MNKFEEIWHFLTEGKPDEVQKYIQKGGKINFHNKKNETVLFDANVNLLQILLDGGIDINHVNTNGENALFKSNFESSKILIKNSINIHQLNKENENCLFYFNYEERGITSKFKLLLDNGINYNQINIYNEHVLFNANSWLTDVLLFDKGNILFDINQLNIFDEHCLTRYIENDYYNKLFLLLKKGFNPDYIDFNDDNIKHSEYYHFFVQKKQEYSAMKEKTIINESLHTSSEHLPITKKRI